MASALHVPDRACSRPAALLSLTAGPARRRYVATRSAVLLRADAAHPLEGGAEGERAAVADLVGDGADRRAGLAQQVGGERDAASRSGTPSAARRPAREAPGQRGARDADRAASAATVHGWAGSSCSIRSARPTTGSAVRPVPARRVRPRAARTRRAARRSAAGRAAGRAPPPAPARPSRSRRPAAATSGQSHSSSRSTTQRRQRAQQPPADLALELVGAGQHHGRAVGAVAPGAHAQVRASAQLWPVGVVQRWPGWMIDLRRRGGVVGDRVRLGPAHDRDVAAAEPQRRAGRRARSTPRRARPRPGSAAPRPGCAATTADRGSSAAGTRPAPGGRRAGRRGVHRRERRRSRMDSSV